MLAKGSRLKIFIVINAVPVTCLTEALNELCFLQSKDKQLSISMLPPSWGSTM